MLAIKNADIYILYLMLAISLIPLLSLIGHIFTREGRESLRINPLLIIYFIIYPAYAYLFWLRPDLLVDFLGMNFNFRILVYGFLCFVPLLRRDLPN